MNNKFAPLILLTIIVSIIAFLFLSHLETTEEEDEPKENIIKQENKPEKIISKKKSEKPLTTIPSALPTETKPIEAPIVEGRKERQTILTQKDELYTDELVLDREKVSFSDPIPDYFATPKAQFLDTI